jgi:hypothetical protein
MQIVPRETPRLRGNPAKLIRMPRSENAAKEPWSAEPPMIVSPAQNEEHDVTGADPIALSASTSAANVPDTKQR